MFSRTTVAWSLPDHIADVLPSEARHIEELRRLLLDTARAYGYELVMPPLLEHLESLLTGTGQALDLQTFKLVDQLSGRTLGLRGDTTPQVARIDAHLLGRRGVTRLCYCGPVLHTRPQQPHATREPLQFGAEIYGHAGLEADLEALSLAQDCLAAAQVRGTSIDLAHAGIVRALLAQQPEFEGFDQVLLQVHAALASKDASALAELTQGFEPRCRADLLTLVGLYGDEKVLFEAENAFRPNKELLSALSDLKWLARHLDTKALTFDLADLRGYAYYSGPRFMIYAQGQPDAVLRGGRYDGVGEVFGRRSAGQLPAARAAAGFSLDLKQLVSAVAPHPSKAAIRAPWGEDAALRAAIAAQRAQGQVVVCALPGHESEIDEFHCDRELTEIAGQWVVKASTR
ncbi:MAG: ATP phosphoribosyltransferase regulatory subunit [Burkholderiaceae bacterium]